MAYVYLHKTKGEGNPFYIGIGKNESNNYGRAKAKKGRNPFWKRVAEKHDYEIEILKDGITWDEAKELEKKYIKEYKEKGYRLTNMTEGGDGTVGWKMPDEQKRNLKEFNSNKKVTVGGLIKRLSEYPPETPLYIGCMVDGYGDKKRMEFDNLCVDERVMITKETQDELDGRYWEGDYQKCVIILPDSKLEWFRTQKGYEREWKELDDQLTYNEGLSGEESDKLEKRMESLDKLIHITNNFL